MGILSRRNFLCLGGPAALAALLPATPLIAYEPQVRNQPYNTLTEEEEIALGRKFAAEYEKKVEIIDNPVFDHYLNRLVKRLGDASQRPHWPFQVKVANLAAVNAQAIPGGIIFVNRGLLDFAQDENELAGVVGHEVGHVVARHTTNQLVLNFIARKLYERVKKNVLLNNDVIGRLIETLGGPVVLLAQLKYSRENESEADMLGFYEMLRAGWNPAGLMRFFERMERAGGASNLFQVMLSDHPASSERAAAIRREMNTVKITAPPFSQPFEFRTLKAALRVLPPPPKSR